jgi:hypothetical protein
MPKLVEANKRALVAEVLVAEVYVSMK